MKQEFPLEKRIQIVESIKKDLLNKLGSNILSATIYGSTLGDDFCITSDFDFLILLRKAEPSALKIIKDIKNKYRKKGLSLDMSIHTKEETPEKREDVFWHNNRALYMQIELNLYGTQLIGKPFLTNIKPNTLELKRECVKIINSFKYHTRKALAKEQLTKSEIRNYIKLCLYAVLYTLAFYDIYPKTKTEALKIFDEKFNFKQKSIKFYKMKTEKPLSLNTKDLESAYGFLCEIDSKIIKDYNNTKK